MAMQLNERTGKAVIVLKDNSKVEYDTVVIDYSSRVIKAIHGGNRVIIPFEAVNAVVIQETREVKQ